MLCVNLQGFQKVCQQASSGIANVVIFDNKDFDFTQVAPTAGVINPYSVIALKTGATAAAGGKMYPIQFDEDNTAEYTFKRADGKNASYEHEIKAHLSGVNQNLSNFLMSLDAASYCCGIGVVIRFYSGKIIVIGERSVNGSEIAPFLIRHSATEGTSGKAFSDDNGATLDLKGTYSRPALEYSGTWDSIEALINPA